MTRIGDGTGGAPGGGRPIRLAVRGRAAVASAIDGEAVRDMPLGPDYRSLVRLAPGVQVTQDSVRGPAAGGSGQENVYRFDGVDVSLPMFGTLSAELSSHDVDQVTFERAGATAVGFNRSGGFTIDSTARSGTNAFAGSVEYTVEPRGLRAEPETVLGPVLTHAPSDQVLLNAGFRTSRREENCVSVGPYEADSVSLGGRADQRVANVDGVWQTGVGALSFRFSDYELEGSSRPDVARETLSRESNGWGAIESPGGVDLAEDGTPVFYVATVQQMSLRRPDGTVVSPIGLPSYFSSTNRYAEQAGSRRGPSHWQLDLGYTQRFRLRADLGARLRVDLFNLFDRQTGYNMNPFRRDAAFGEPRDRFDPRRVQISVSVDF